MASSPRHLLPILGLLGTLSGCGLVRLGGVAAGPADAPPSGDPVGAAEGTGSADGANGARFDLAGAYAAWTFESCASAHAPSCGAAFAARAGDPHHAGQNPPHERDPRSEPNPDPVWLPGWETLPSGANHADVVYAALAAAASEKTYLADCNRRFDDYFRDQSSRLAAVQSKIDAALARSNPYDRLQALGDIERPARTKPADAATYALETAMAKAYLEAGRAVTYGERNLKPKVDLRPLFDEETERDLFCSANAPTLDLDDAARAAVKPLYTKERLDALAASVRAANEETATFFAMKGAPRPPSHLGGTVKTAEKRGSTWVVTLYEEAEGVHEDRSRCVAITLVTARCPTVNTKTETTTHLVFTDLPDTAAFAPNDAVSVRGTVADTKSKTVQRASETVDVVDVEFTVAFLDAIEHDHTWVWFPSKASKR